VGTRIRERVTLMFAIPFLLLTLLFAGGIFVAFQSDRASRDGQAASTTIAAIDAVRDALVDAQTGIRGYLLTQNAFFLAPFRETQRTLDVRLTVLRHMVEAEPARSAAVESVAASARSELSILEYYVLLQRTGRHAAAVKAVASRGGQIEMDRLEGLIDASNASRAMPSSSRPAIRWNRSCRAMTKSRSSMPRCMRWPSC